MNVTNIVLCGLGGQGILFMTKILAQTALGEGIDVIGAETHGMAQRGGSVISHLRLGTGQGSLINLGQANYLIALDENEAYRNLPFLAPQSWVYVNASTQRFPHPTVKAYLDENKIVYRALPVSELILAIGAPKAANLAMIGFFAAFGDIPFQPEALKKTIDRISPSRFKEVNQTVFDYCYAKGRQAAS